MYWVDVLYIRYDNLILIHQIPGLLVVTLNACFTPWVVWAAED